jgi:hypothetical protein
LGEFREVTFAVAVSDVLPIQVFGKELGSEAAGKYLFLLIVSVFR